MVAYPEHSIAICGIGCRFPGGVTDSRGFWNLMVEGRDGIVPVPGDRWDAERFYDREGKVPGTMYVNAGGFLRQPIDEFDASFFGISPREASRLDPQQRLMLEVAWEALEDAGMPHDRLAGTQTGVFVGGFMSDNLLTQLNPLNRDMIGPHSEIGATLGILSNRLSHFFDLRGPSLTVDTACSSSLTAFHLACRSLIEGECDVALAGGVNVMSRPENPIAMSKGGFLARDGRCKSFDARGDGYGRGEGAGVVVLKRLEDAIRDGDHIIAVVRGSGANQDGRTDGITVPSRAAQAELVRRVYTSAGVDPSRIGYIEAHGTGTAVGDPIEASALGHAIGEHRDAGSPAFIGSVKANIGHLEAAAGIAGVIKAALALRHGVVPVLANLETPNPKIPFGELGLRLPLSSVSMTERDGERFYAVNSFGYGGSNAHVLLQDWAGEKQSATCDEAERPFFLLPLSARSEEALTYTARRHGELLRDEGVSVGDICYTAACRRSHLEQRLAVIGSSASELADRLSAFVNGEEEGVVVGRADLNPHDPVFVFTGMGPQWWAMGRELYASEPVFKAAADQCDLAFRRCAGWSILEEMLRDEADSRMERTEIAQPANFLLQVALTKLWVSWGVRPKAVVGHSVGEVVSACVSGSLTLEEAAEVSFHRSRIQKRAAGQGRMLALGATEDQALELASPHLDVVSIAAINGPNSSVLAGDAAALEAIAAEAAAAGLFNRFLQVEVPYHSPAMDPLKDDLLAALSHLAPRPTVVPTWSTVTGKRVDGTAFDGQYFCDNVREPVRFASAITDLINSGHRAFLEIGPHPVLSNAIRECAAKANAEVTIVSSMHRGKPELDTVRGALASAYVSGIAVHWESSPLWRGSLCSLPHYPWQREVHWEESEAALRDRLGQESHPLVGTRLSTAAAIWEKRMGGSELAFMQDHVVDGLVLLPGAAYVEIGVVLQALSGGSQAGHISDVEFGQALVLDRNEWPRLQIAYDPAHETVSIFSWQETSSEWRRHARLRLGRLPLTAPPRCDLGKMKAALRYELDGSQHYRRMSERGLNYGAAFQGVRRLWLSEGVSEVLAEIEAPAEIISTLDRYTLHPALLDACFQTLLETIGNPVDRDVYVPTVIENLRFYKKPGYRLFAYACNRVSTGRSVRGDLLILDQAGDVCASFEGIVAQALTDKAAQERSKANERLFGLKWVEKEYQGNRGAGRRLVISRKHTSAAQLAALLPEAQMLPVGDAMEAVAVLDRAFAKASSDRISGVVFLAHAEDLANDPAGLGLASDFLLLVQHVARLQKNHQFVLDVVTVVAQAPAEAPSEGSLSQAALTGLARVAIAEEPNLRMRVVDIDGTAASLAALAIEIQGMVDDDDVALRAGTRFVRRLCSASFDTIGQLKPRAAGRTASTAEPLAVDEVEIAARRIVRQTLDIAGDRDHGTETALYALGEVVRVGDSSLPFSVGDTVSAPVLSAASYQRVHQKNIQRIRNGEAGFLPEQMQAVAPLLCDAFHVASAVAKLSANDVVLMIGAADLKACATAQIVRELCGRLVVAAPSEASEHIYRALGLDVVLCDTADSLDIVKASLGPAGADVVIVIGRTDAESSFMRLLSAHGRYVSWRDGDRGPAATEVRDNQSYASVCMERIRHDPPPDYEKKFPALLEFLRQHRGLHLPLESITPREQPLSATTTLNVPPLDSRKTYLVTGGLGGFGLETAKWLVGHGVRNLVLAGRSSKHSADVLDEVDLIRMLGVSVKIVSVDVTESADVERLIAEIQAGPAPLGGIFHAAAVLDDGPMDTLRPSQLETAMRAKALGAWHLHRLTENIPLDHFVMFSSISSLVGSPGQGSYVAANTFLDALAAYRSARGLAGTAINWGAISEVGMAARRKEISDYLTGVGFGLMKPQEALAALAPVIAQGLPNVAIAKMDWATLSAFYAGWRFSRRNEEIVASISRDGEPAKAGSQASKEEIHLLADRLASIVGAVLKIGEDRIDRKKSLVALGLDSILAIEIQARIEAEIGVKLSVLDLLRGVSIADLKQRLEDLILVEAQPPQMPAENAEEMRLPSDAADIDAYLDTLSEAELGRLIDDSGRFGREVA